MAPIYLLDDEEEFHIDIEGTKFYYKQLSGKTKERIVKRNDKRGKINWAAVGHDMLKAAITRTDNLRDKNGDVIPWNPEYVYFLPGKATELLIEQIEEDIERTEGEKQNLSITPDSNIKTED